MPYEHLTQIVFDQPHLYDARKAAAFIRSIGPRLTGREITIVNGRDPVDHVAFSGGRPSAGVLGDRLGRAYDRHNVTPFQVIDNVAVIAVEGTLIQKGSWVGSSSGETSYEGLRMQIARARRSEAVKGVVFEVDSFGGQVNGAFETAEDMRQLSREKPTISILTDYAYSAGYLLASQARQVVMPEFGGAGSIGVVMMHADFSGAMEQEGIKVTFIHAGKHKVDGNPFEPLASGIHGKWQTEVDEMRDRFAMVVGKARGARFSKSDALKTEAETFSAKQALEIGLVDAVADGQATFEAFIKEINRKA